MEDTGPYLKPTSFIDSDSPRIDEAAGQFSGIEDATHKAIAIYEYVRDAFIYDPYHLDLRAEALRASAVLDKKRAWCVEKAILCCALLRACGIPARLGFGIVTNHIGVEKLRSYLQRDEIVFHGFTEVLLEGRWSKCTPAFDTRICRLNGVAPLSWNGREDSLLHPFRGTEKYMEYMHFYGSFADVPLELMNREMAKYYPHLVGMAPSKEFSLVFDPSVIPG